MTNEQGLPTRPFLGLSGLFPGRLVLLVVAAAVLGLALMLTAGSIAFAEDATSTSFAPNSVTLENIGDKATITLATEGADPIVSGVQVRIMHPDTLAVSGVRCTGIFDGGFSTESPQSGGGTLVGCARLSGSITSPTGDMMTFELERVGPFTAAQTVTIAPLGGPDSTFFSSEGQTVGGPGTTNELIVSPGEIPPVANAGEDQEVAVGATVTLDGSGSTGAATYRWTLTTVPESSNATASLTGADTAMASFVADLAGTYEAQLVVNDGTEDSAPDSVSIVATDVIENTPPVAAAGEDQDVATGDTVTLDGSGSADADGDSLTYAWSLITMPEGSTASLTGAATASPSFVADLAGTYEAQLVVNDGIEDSAPDTVSIEANSAPVSAAGDDQTVQAGDTVTLDGSGSTDADGDTLTYAWTLTTVPEGSTASLTGAETASPSFVADLAGTYQAQLVVNDETEDSAADTVSVVAFDLV
ncbi:MAG TPA: PKD domain-containing protein, partial [Dehalococcoidia bacterium]|nr:PKD domain-containing protein [Dehalococcoidia bacterium]